MASGPLVVLARRKGEARWTVRVGEGRVELDGLGLELDQPAAVVLDAATRSIRLELNKRLERSPRGDDGRSLTKPFTVTARAGVLEFVCFCVDDEHHAPPTPAIMKAIEAVRARDDESTRVVLGDVLEESGAVAEAEYVRLELDLQRSSPSDDGFIEAVRRLRTLSAVVGPTFRYLVGRDIEGCSGVRWAFRCPTTWADLTPTNVSSERVCKTCRQVVVQVASEADARRLAREGVCTSPREEFEWVGSISGPEGGPLEAASPREERGWVGSVAVMPRPPPSAPPVQPKPAPKRPWWKRLLRNEDGRSLERPLDGSARRTAQKQVVA